MNEQDHGLVAESTPKQEGRALKTFALFRDPGVPLELIELQRRAVVPPHPRFPRILAPFLAPCAFCGPEGRNVLVFIGYSFPVADLYFSSILRSVLAIRDGAPGIVLVNPDAVALARRLGARARRRLLEHLEQRALSASRA